MKSKLKISKEITNRKLKKKKLTWRQFSTDQKMKKNSVQILLASLHSSRNFVKLRLLRFNNNNIP